MVTSTQQLIKTQRAYKNLPHFETLESARNAQWAYERKWLNAWKKCCAAKTEEDKADWERKYIHYGMRADALKVLIDNWSSRTGCTVGDGWE
jgi:hypothetical protein